MKKLTIKYLLSGLVFSASLLSCTDLDENLYDVVTAEETEFTSNELNNIIAPAFTSLRTVYWGWNGLFDVYEESSDLIVTPYRVGIGWGDLYITMHQHTFGPTLEHAANLWANCYSGINNTNRAIYQIENLQAENSEKYIYELRALRAIYYYMLLDNFRNVPLVTKYDLPKGFLPEQSNTEEVYAFIESEIKEVMPHLSEENNQATYGRVTRWAAKMTLAKLYLNSGVYLNTPKWDEALEQVNDIINSGKFSLLSRYGDNFAAENTDTEEEIFSIPFDNKYAAGSYYPYKTLFAASQSTFKLAGEPWGGSAGIPQFINTYDEDDSRLEECWLGGLQYSSTGEPIMVEGFGQLNYTNYMTSVNAAEFNEGYRFIKYEIARGLTGNQGNDVPFYRLADAMMIKAECLLRKGQADLAAEIVTEIRERAFKDAPEKATVTGADLMAGSTYAYGEYENGAVTEYEGGADIEFGRFLDELAWEFVGEHHRKQDLIRFGVYTKKSWLSHKPNGDHYIIFPIPQDQRNTNTNLDQNPGYEQ